MSEQEMSKSKQKRLAIENARKAQRRKKSLAIMWSILIPVLIIGVIATIILVDKASEVNYEKGLNEDGTIALDSIDDYVSVNYAEMSFAKSDLLPDDATVESDIASTLENYQYVSDDASLTSVSGDKVNINYEATIDGVSYNAVTAEDGGADFTIGEASISSDFDEALIGHKAGDTFSADISYAEDDSDTELAGKTVHYEITFNGIYVTPELTDEFVAENLSDQASTAEEYRQSIIDDYYQSNLKSAVTDYIKNTSSVNRIPVVYRDNLIKVYNALNEQQMEYTNQMYQSYFGTDVYDSVSSMFGYSTQEEYDAYVTETATDDVKFSLELQYVYEKEGMTNTEEEVKAYLFSQGYDESSYSEALETYGYKYLAHNALLARVVEHLGEIATITE